MPHAVYRNNERRIHKCSKAFPSKSCAFIICRWSKKSFQSRLQRQKATLHTTYAKSKKVTRTSYQLHIHPATSRRDFHEATMSLFVSTHSLKNLKKEKKIQNKSVYPKYRVARTYIYTKCKALYVYVDLWTKNVCCKRFFMYLFLQENGKKA